MPYPVGGLVDKTHEAFGGTHDTFGSGLYDEQGNITRGLSNAERTAREAWSAAAIVPAAPFALAEALPPQVWQAISILLKGVK